MRYHCRQRGGVQYQNFDCDDDDDNVVVVLVGVSACVACAAGTDAAAITVETSF